LAKPNQKLYNFLFLFIILKTLSTSSICCVLLFTDLLLGLFFDLTPGLTSDIFNQRFVPFFSFNYFPHITIITFLFVPSLYLTALYD